jgi:hypothetical protein
VRDERHDIDLFNITISFNLGLVDADNIGANFSTLYFARVTHLRVNDPSTCHSKKYVTLLTPKLVTYELDLIKLCELNKNDLFYTLHIGIQTSSINDGFLSDTSESLKIVFASKARHIIKKRFHYVLPIYWIGPDVISFLSFHEHVIFYY